ncbi:hypothetical protein Rhopal_000513-T1 [Rhodotorula paludigena]|uniref:PROP1-like PPR domain-containing protein n=1 Tax=Rhodotorula paludigena TaxID=86838 RepID=A0AAV5GDX5_9BASI|nr:hypothetical protein Rhopal_000513-T1 [Rhodotorula paludigena]
MLSAARRSASLAGASALARLEAHQLAVRASSTQPAVRALSSTAAVQGAEKPRLSKAKRAERRDKLADKREVRAIRRERERAKEELARQAELARRTEVQDKLVVAEDIAASLPPLSEEQLEAMYQGLIQAPPEELALPALAASTAPALPDPAADSLQRQDRLSRLAQRLEDFENELAEEEGAEAAGEKESSTSLAQRLRERRGEAGATLAPTSEQPLHLVDTVSPARAILDHLEATLPNEEVPPAEAPAEAGGPVSRGLLVRSEWNDLVLACAEAGDREGVLKSLRLMERTTPIAEGKVLEDTLAIYASQGKAQDALIVANFARQNSLPLSVTAHHHLLVSILPSHPHLALRHLRSMEATGHTPLLPTYTAVIQRFLSAGASPDLVRQGWDLYSHTRLVSYPVPDVPLFSTMIQACSQGAHPSPERAIDLFTEMTDDHRLAPSERAYNGVIRSCAREGSQEYYYEALRFMRRMLDENVAPTRRTFHALLEGAKRHGDLARARWMLVKMVGVGGEAAPDETTLALVLQTYAAYRPTGGRAKRESKPMPVDQPGAVEKEDAPQETEDAIDAEPTEPKKSPRPSSTLDAKDDPTDLPVGPPSGASASTLEVIKMLGEASLFYPGPLPTTSAEVVAEAQNLMLQVVDASVLASDESSAAMSEQAPRDSGMFPSVSPSTFLVNAYLSVLNSHASFATAHTFFRHAYTRLDLPKNRYSYEIMLRRCELAKNRDEAVRVAKEVWDEWIRWSEEPAPLAEGERPIEELEADEQELARERRKRVEEDWARDRRAGRHVSKMWAGLIRILAKAYKEDEAIAVLQRFHATYPSSALRSLSDKAAPLSPITPLLDRPAVVSYPSVPIRISSPLYPETAPSRDASRPPYLLFDDLKILHKRLADVEDRERLEVLHRVCGEYFEALKTARKREIRDEGKRREF